MCSPTPCDVDSIDVLHHEVRLPAFGRTCFEHLCDVAVLHHRQGLKLEFEAFQHLLAVHAQLDDLQGHPPANRLLLLGQVDSPHAAFAEDLQDLERSNLLGRLPGFPARLPTGRFVRVCAKGPLQHPIQLVGWQRFAWLFELNGLGHGNISPRLTVLDPA